MNAAAIADPKPVLKEGELYLGDNGRCFCIAHAGASAKYSGRDLSGQRVHKVTAAARANLNEPLHGLRFVAEAA